MGGRAAPSLNYVRQFQHHPMSPPPSHIFLPTQVPRKHTKAFKIGNARPVTFCVLVRDRAKRSYRDGDTLETEVQETRCELRHRRTAFDPASRICDFGDDLGRTGTHTAGFFTEVFWFVRLNAVRGTWDCHRIVTGDFDLCLGFLGGDVMPDGWKVLKFNII